MHSGCYFLSYVTLSKYFDKRYFKDRINYLPVKTGQEYIRLRWGLRQSHTSPYGHPHVEKQELTLAVQKDATMAQHQLGLHV